jgi:HEAT repeat protein
MDEHALESLRVAVSGPDDGVRPSLLTGLSDLPAGQAGEAREVLQTAPVDRRLRLLAACRELAEDNIEYTFKTLFLIGLEDPDARVRQVAVDGLWEEDGVQILHRLESLLLSDRSPEVCAAAAQMLGRFAYGAAVGDLGPSVSDHLRETLRRALADAPDGSTVQMRCVESLSWFHDDPLLNDQIGRLYREGDEEEQASALVAMGRSMRPEWREAIASELSSESPRLRFHAARAAGEMMMAETVPALARLAEEADPEVRENAIRALGQIGNRAATQRLQNLAASDMPGVADAAEEALGEALYAGGYE